ncbi:MAG: Fe-S cluster assembly protein SufB, partial [Bifidobacteriaceae bacterium]|nr:Fe-S cluster assembly protein SufB [Bifidobacteriaceae bacterium]
MSSSKSDNASNTLDDDKIINQFQGYSYGWHSENDLGKNAKTGIDAETVKQISKSKNEPKWMLDIRLKALEEFFKMPMPKWGADLSDFDYNSFKYFVRPTDKQAQNWEDLPPDILETYEKLGVPESER